LKHILTAPSRYLVLSAFEFKAKHKQSCTESRFRTFRKPLVEGMETWNPQEVKCLGTIIATKRNIIQPNVNTKAQWKSMLSPKGSLANEILYLTEKTGYLI